MLAETIRQIEACVQKGETDKIGGWVKKWPFFLEGNWSEPEDIPVMYKQAADFIRDNFVVPEDVPVESVATATWGIEHADRLELLNPVAPETAHPVNSEP